MFPWLNIRGNPDFTSFLTFNIWILLDEGKPAFAKGSKHEESKAARAARGRPRIRMWGWVDHRTNQLLASSLPRPPVVRSRKTWARAKNFSSFFPWPPSFRQKDHRHRRAAGYPTRHTELCYPGLMSFNVNSAALFVVLNSITALVSLANKKHGSLEIRIILKRILQEVWSYGKSILEERAFGGNKSFFPAGLKKTEVL